MTKLEQFKNRLNDIKRCSHPQMRKKRAEVLLNDMSKVYSKSQIVESPELLNLYVEVDRT